MNKNVKTILIVVALILVAYFVYNKFFKNSNSSGASGTFAFKWMGGSRLRGEDCNSGQPYGFLEIGTFDENGNFIPDEKANCPTDTQCKILEGDEITITSVQGGSHNLPLEGNKFTVLQRGTDTCGNPILYPNNGVLIDLDLNDSYQYNGIITGTFKRG